MGSDRMKIWLCRRTPASAPSLAPYVAIYPTRQRISHRWRMDSRPASMDLWNFEVGTASKRVLRACQLEVLNENSKNCHTMCFGTHQRAGTDVSLRICHRFQSSWLLGTGCD